jgi:anti-sigma factor ChrR (cupin superfamily)
MSSEVYWAMRKRADQIARTLEDTIWKHEDDEAWWDRILEKYEAWLRQEEEAARVPCIENDGRASYTPSETLFYILGRRGRHADAESYVQRLALLQHHDPEGKWQAALDLIRRENQAEAEHQAWLATVPEQVQQHASQRRAPQLLKLAALCVSREEPAVAQTALDALLTIGGTSEDAINVLRAGICRLKNRYADAIRHLQAAYPTALASATKARINKVEVEMRKVLKEKGAEDPTTEASRLLAVAQATVPHAPQREPADAAKQPPDQAQVPSASTQDIAFLCPHCGQHLTADSTMSGDTVECPTCKGTLVIPSQTTEAEPSPAPYSSPVAGSESGEA